MKLSQNSFDLQNRATISAHAGMIGLLLALAPYGPARSNDYVGVSIPLAKQPMND
jgi:hypothetical protein